MVDHIGRPDLAHGGVVEKSSTWRFSGKDRFHRFDSGDIYGLGDSKNLLSGRHHGRNHYDGSDFSGNEPVFQ